MFCFQLHLCLVFIFKIEMNCFTVLKQILILIIIIDNDYYLNFNIISHFCLRLLHVDTVFRMILILNFLLIHIFV